MKKETVAKLAGVVILLNLLLTWGAAQYEKADSEGVRAPTTGQAARTSEAQATKIKEEAKGTGNYETTRSDEQKGNGITQNGTAASYSDPNGKGSTEEDPAYKGGTRRVENGFQGTGEPYEDLDKHFHEMQAAERQAAEETRAYGSCSYRGLDAGRATGGPSVSEITN